MKKLLKPIIYLLVAVFIASAVPGAALADTTPPDMYVEQAQAKLDKLIEKLDGKYFSTTQEPCAYGESGHGCDKCYNANVIKAGWLTDLGLIVPEDANLMPGSYFPDGDLGYPKGDGCYGFANYAHWYIFAEKSSDKVVPTKIGICEFTYDALQKLGVCPGDVLRFDDREHTVVFVSYTGSTGIKVINCNWRTTSDAANSRIQVMYFSFDPSEKVAVTGTANYKRTRSTKVESITVSASSSEVTKGSTLQMNAAVLPTDAGIRTVRWSVENTEGEAVIDENGLLTAKAMGEVTVTASAMDDSGVSGSMTVTVLPLMPQSIETEPEEMDIKVNETAQIGVKILPEDADLPTGTYSFSSDDTSVAAVSDSGEVTGVSPGKCNVTVSFSGLSVSVPVTVIHDKPERLILDGPTEIYVNQTAQYNVGVEPIGVVLEDIVWSVTEGYDLCVIDEYGELSAKAPGAVRVKAADKFYPDVYAELDVLIKPVLTDNIIIEGDAQMLRTEKQTLTAHSDNHATDERVSWSVENVTGEAEITEDGVVTALAAGTVKVRADALDGSGAYAYFEITIFLREPEEMEISGPDSVQKLSEGTYTVKYIPEECDVEEGKLVWSVSDTSVATIDENGVLSAVKVGTVTVKATYKDISATREVSVTPIPAEKITLSGPDKLMRNETAKYTAAVEPDTADIEGIVFSVENGTGEATIDESGVLTPVKSGTVTVRAASAADQNVSDSIEVTIEPVKVTAVAIEGPTSIPRTAVVEYTLKLTPADADAVPVKWSITEKDGAATVDEKGSVKGVSEGKVILRAELTDGSGLYDEVEITVTPVEVTSLEIIGEKSVMKFSETVYTVKYLPEDADVDEGKLIWSVSDTGLATVDKDGKLSALKPGTVRLTATYGSVKTTVDVEIKPIPVERLIIIGSKEIVRKATSTYTVKFEPVNADLGEVEWSIKNDTGEATVDKNGVVTGVKTGTVTVTVKSKTDEKLTASMNVTIVPIKVTEIKIEGKDSMAVGSEATYKAVVSPSDADNTSYKWSIVEKTGKATIDKDGKFKATAEGEVVVKAEAQDGSKVVAEKTVKITKATPVTLVISPENGSVAVGGSLNMKAEVKPAGSSMPKLVWSVSDSAVATIDASGVLTAVNVGTVTVKAVSATNAAMYDTAIINIVPIKIEAVRLEDTNAFTGTVLKAMPIPSEATGTYEWYADGVRIEGANADTFTVTLAETAKKITAKFTGTGKYSGTAESLPSQTVTAVINSDPVGAYTPGAGKDLVIRVSADLKYLSSVTIKSPDGDVIRLDPKALPDGVSLKAGSTVLTVTSDYALEHFKAGEYTFQFGFVNDTVTHKAAVTMNEPQTKPSSPFTGETGKIIIAAGVGLLALIILMIVLRNKKKRAKEEDDEDGDFLE
ncbi:MAG: Ig-like domain-containing protein [Eubacteriaceae bacterium]|nr:Ig-like domain-containing protein [Eubacteriaceae bacterium]